MNKNTTNNFFVLFLTLFTSTFAYTIFTIFGIDGFFALILSFIIGAVLYTSYFKKIYSKREMPTNSKLKGVSKEKEKYYQSRGLSDKDIVFFRETMNKTKMQILQVEKNMNEIGKLKAISNRNNTINLIKVLFKDIVKEPERLSEVDQFLYVHLPSLVDLTNKHVQIDQHQAKSKQTYDILEKSAQTIDEVCQQVTDDYMKFRSTDLNDLTDEMDLATKRLNREGSNIAKDEI